MFQRFRENHLKIKPQKCQLFQTEAIFLGIKVKREGITVDPSKTGVIVNWKVPTTTKERHLLSLLERQIQRQRPWTTINFAKKSLC